MMGGENINESYFPISQIRQYFFCPRINWFSSTIGTASEKIWMEQGRSYHTEREVLLRKRILRKFSDKDFSFHYDKKVISHSLGVYGVCDGYMETDQEVVPLEFKLSSNSVNKGGYYQLLAYGIALSEMLGKSLHSGYFITGKSAKIAEKRFSDIDII
ncbi:MAG: CRISPR-associated protein Cas4, partial [Leptospiraceae bacterium]|nr:CRISPR-associated protein Cas4 [Leptospiraceae bacterium]